jgi:hypothetical protein
MVGNMNYVVNYTDLNKFVNYLPHDCSLCHLRDFP